MRHCSECEDREACERDGSCARNLVDQEGAKPEREASEPREESGAALAGAPVEEDKRFDDEEFNPAIEPKKAQAWLNLLEESEKAFQDWNDHGDKIDKRYANMMRLSDGARGAEFQMFWANMETLKPTLYARPPQPVVVTKYKDRRPVYTAAAELLERTATTAFDMAHVDLLMRQVRDDLCMLGRGVAWCRYEAGGKDSGYITEKVCIDFKQRKDFLHSVSRSWAEVWWVAGASYLTRAEARKRFRKYSGDEYQEAEYEVDKDGKEIGGADKRERAKFWEIWDRKNRRCVWVAKGCEHVLDESDPILDLTNFFPCPRPAYGVMQRGSLVPVPDALQYKDQLDELDQLTARIHALTDALRAKGFYPSGGGEVAEAIQAAIAAQTDGRVLVPVANWAAFGGSKEVIIWLPIADIAQTIQTCVALRKEIIQDIYQIVGLSDIMRGATDARETLGAQELKSQFGSIRTRDKQLELVRFARDLVEIITDIITDRFDDATIIYMSQTQLPTREMQERQVMEIQQQLQMQQQQFDQMAQTPQGQQALQQNPEGGQKFQQLMQQGEQAIAKVMAKPTFEQVMHFLRSMRSRTFTLDIETDSTILIDENTEKQRRAEFTGVLAQLLPQMAQMITAEPMTAGFCGEVLKFATAPFRVGRSLNGAIDDLVMLMESKAQQPKGDDPTTATNKTNLQIEQMKNTTQQQKDQAELQLKAQELQQKDEVARMKLQSQERIQLAKLKENEQNAQNDMARSNLEMVQAREEHQQKMLEMQGKMQLDRQKVELAERNAVIKQHDMEQRRVDQRNAQQFKEQQAMARDAQRGVVQP